MDKTMNIDLIHNAQSALDELVENFPSTFYVERTYLRVRTDAIYFSGRNPKWERPIINFNLSNEEDRKDALSTHHFGVGGKVIILEDESIPYLHYHLERAKPSFLERVFGVSDKKLRLKDVVEQELTRRSKVTI